MPRYEILDAKGKVVNTIIADPAFAELHHPGRYRQIEDAPPGPPPVPQIVSRFQARAAMMMAPSISGDFANLLAEINAAVDASNDPLAQLAWAEAVEWRRDSPVVNSLGTAVGVTQDQLDELFRAAAGIIA